MYKFSHKNRTIFRPFCLGLIAVILLGAQIVRASDGHFQNNLLKMDVYKTSQGGLKVNLYTTKPYSDTVVVNKKSDTEYVILMPETASSMTSKPTAKAAPDVLTNIEVKTQQYGSTQGQKGYTKIIISTLKPVEIIPQLQTVSTSDYQLSEKETQELITQAGKKHVTQAKAAKTMPKTVSRAQIATPVAIKKVEAKKQIQTIAQKSAVTAQTSAQKAANKPTPILSKKAPGVAALKKEDEKIQTQKILPPSKSVSPASNREIKPTVALQKTQVDTPILAPVITPKVTPTAVTVGKYQKYKDLAMANIDIWSLVLIPIILLLLALRIAKKNKEKQPLDMSKSKPPTPMATTSDDYSEGIMVDLDWKEKLKTYKTQPRPTDEASLEQTEEVSETVLAEDGWLVDEPSVFTETQYGENTEDSEWGAIEATDDDELEQEETPQQSQQKEQINSIEDSSWLDFEDDEILKDASIENLFNYNEESFDEQFSEKLGEDLEDSEEATEEIYGGFLHSETLNDNPQETQNEVSIEGYGDYQELESETALEDFFVEEASEEITFTGDYQGVLEPQEIIEAASQEDLQEDLIEKELGLSKKSGFSIDETKGLYLLDFEETTALVGYIGEDVFVLKRFEEPIVGTIKARITEHKGDCVNFMVRIADFKALVEVKPNNMNLLIEL